VLSRAEKINSIPNPFVKEKGMAGLAWVQGFSRRNPMIASRKAQNLSTVPEEPRN